MIDEKQRFVGSCGVNRRNFIQLVALSGPSLALANFQAGDMERITLRPEEMLGSLKEDGRNTPLENATWYRAAGEGDGLL
jgi:hypothetical protein